jgi:hypothetical protein
MKQVEVGSIPLILSFLDATYNFSLFYQLIWMQMLQILKINICVMPPSPMQDKQ